MVTGTATTKPTVVRVPSLRKEHEMESMESQGTLLDQVQSAVQADPAAAKQKVAELKQKIQGLSAEQKAQLREAAPQIQQRLQNLSDEQKAQLADIVQTIRSA
jgi:predicted secreted Zn-dependent protease